MQMFVEPLAIYLHRKPVDFRKSINGLSALVEQSLQLPVFSGALFVFCNKKRDRIKILNCVGTDIQTFRLDIHIFDIGLATHKR